jgi:hypothetical protein
MTEMNDFSHFDNAVSIVAPRFAMLFCYLFLVSLAGGYICDYTLYDLPFRYY